MQRTRDGLFETSDGEEVGEWDLSAVRAAYRYTAGDWDVLLSFDAVRDDSDPRPFALTEEGDAAEDDGDVYTLFSGPFFVSRNPFGDSDATAARWSRTAWP